MAIKQKSIMNVHVGIVCWLFCLSCCCHAQQEEPDNPKDELKVALDKAIQSKDVVAVNRILREGEKFDLVEGKGGDTPLHYAATIDDNREVIQLLIKLWRPALESRNERGSWTPLFYAAVVQNAENVRALLDAGANVRGKDEDGDTPLLIALTSYRPGMATSLLEIVSLLIEHGSDVNVQNKKGWMPLRVALEEGHQDIVALLKKAGARCENEISHALLGAVRQGDRDKARTLLRQGARIETTDRRGYTVLMRAAESGDAALVRDLLLLKPRLNVHRIESTWLFSNDMTALMLAAEKGHAEVIEALLKAGADVNVEDQSGYKALHLAAGNRHLEAVRVFLANGVDINQKDRAGYTPLMIAAGGFIFFFPDPSEEAALSVVRELIEKGADVNAKLSNGKTVLQLAGSDSPKIVELLKKAGAKE